MKNIGYVFQNYYLIPTLKAFENIEVPMLINKDIDKKNRKEKAMQLLKKINLDNRANHYPSELSGGEQQRIAILRALVNNPSIILADEPTGNLDEDCEQEIFKLLKDISKEGKCVIVVSHSNEIKKYTDEVYNMCKGKISKNENK